MARVLVVRHEVVGEAGNGTEALARYQELKPKVTTLDITMPRRTA
jgi:two-component system, chemotaxis family, chemotaxis protein CheY